MRRTGVALGVLAFALLAGCSSTDESASDSPSNPVSASSPTAEEELLIQGMVAISPAHAIADESADECLAWGDYTAFNAEDLQVVVSDATGTTVGVADAEPAEYFQDGCVRPFVVSVPAGGEYYTATVGDWSSDTYSEAELATTNLVVAADA